MTQVLITAFQPYDRWPVNASWLTLVELTRDLPSEPRVVTRLYPVDFEAARELLIADLSENFELAIHLGQAPGSARLRLEAIALNLRQSIAQNSTQKLLADEPLAYESTLPLMSWTERLKAAGIPTEVSHFAGTYLCNAVLYYSLHYSRVLGLQTQSMFLHVPLDPSQTAAETQDMPCLPVSYGAAALRLILAEFALAAS
jgi:pyroglutamyl-peptidase